MDAPVAACLAHDVVVPPDLHAMVDLFRDAPVKWFTQIAPLLDRLDRLDTIQQTMQQAKLRAGVQDVLRQPVRSVNGGETSLGQAVSKVFAARQTFVAQYRQQTAQLDLAVLAEQSWQHVRDQAQQTLSLGDLIEGGHGHAEVAQQAAQELENLSHVAGCLYALFGQVLPAIRLAWAELLSQYDAAVNLRNLSALPRWPEIPYLERREMQMLADWLFQRIDPRESDAADMINDLSRVCILLASHAPVKQIIAGHVNEATPVQLGTRVQLTVDPAKVRVGMQVLVYKENTVVTRAVVEDLSAGVAAARVVHTTVPTLEQGARAHFTESTGIEDTSAANRLMGLLGRGATR